MKLYAYWRSSCSWRVRIALAHKGVAHEIVPVHLLRSGGEQLQEAYRGRNPMGQVPTLEWQENGQIRSLGQSMAICEYLERRYPDPPLFPADPFLSAKARELAELVNAGIQPLQNLRVMKRLKKRGVDPAEWNREVMEEGFHAVEAILGTTAGQYSVGDSVSIADVFLVPQVYNARRFEVDMSRFPTLSSVEGRLATLEPFVVSHPSRQPDAEGP